MAKADGAAPQDSEPKDRNDAELVERLARDLSTLSPEEQRVQLDKRPLSPEARAEIERALEIPKRVGSYKILRRLGEGGMGVVYVAWREDANNVCALKVIRPDRGSRDLVKRFEREAQVIRRLRHPGIAAFLDAGVGRVEPSASPDDRRPYLAMELVEGDQLTRYANRARLTDRERVEIVARIADALEHAHQQGIIHRDLKPANLLVPEPEDPRTLAQPKIVDFGVARASRTEDLHTLTRTGALVGTLSYMSPEQVAGSSREVGPHSDVYSLCVVLFELLTGRFPYDLRGRSITDVARIIQYEEPTRLGRVSSHLTGDIELVVAKGLEKEPSRRYATAEEFSRDLRAVLERKPVRAKAPDLVRRIRQWAKRHPVGVAALSMGFVALVAVSLLLIQAIHARDEARLQAAVAKEKAQQARQVEEELLRERQRLLQLSDLRSLRRLQERARDLWPMQPSLVDEYEAWLDEAADLESRLPSHRASIDSLRQQEASTLATLGDLERAWWLESLQSLTTDLGSLLDPQLGTRAKVERRLEVADSVWQRSLGDFQDEWDQAIQQIRDQEIYGELSLAPQVGLAPLGPDPESGLQEFWHVDTGEAPLRDSRDGTLILTETTAMVFVLIPGGGFLMGAQTEDPGRPNFDPRAKSEEGPVHPVKLSPFFFGKHEVTQGQWLREMGDNPALYVEGSELGDWNYDLRHPLERVTWTQAQRFLQRFGLTLPSEAQWEYATRGGTNSPWWTGNAPESLVLAGNVADQHCKNTRAPADWQFENWNDGFHAHAPVGSFLANAFGIHDVHGNVFEWCLDAYLSRFYDQAIATDPVFLEVNPEVATHRVLRGGDFSLPAAEARSSVRYYAPADSARSQSGFRAARSVHVPSKGDSP